QELMQVLTNTKENPLPSVRITHFTTLMQRCDAQLKQHRDPEWKRYLKNCLVAIGVVCSLIVPGIIALIAYSSYTGKSSPLFFSNSIGGEYVDKVKSTVDVSSYKVSVENDSVYAESENNNSPY
ncbi:MAG: hypothetical protein PSV35_07890, partial [bacterium]|nr:hypothetical protein [bacterium]